jgi:hypothetical protein
VPTDWPTSSSIFSKLKLADKKEGQTPSSNIIHYLCIYLLIHTILVSTAVEVWAADLVAVVVAAMDHLIVDTKDSTIFPLKDRLLLNVEIIKEGVEVVVALEANGILKLVVKADHSVEAVIVVEILKPRAFNGSFVFIIFTETRKEVGEVKGGNHNVRDTTIGKGTEACRERVGTEKKWRERLFIDLHSHRVMRRLFVDLHSHRVMRRLFVDLHGDGIEGTSHSLRMRKRKRKSVKVKAIT